MPGTSDGLADEYTLVERRRVVRAFSADSEPVRLDVYEKNWFAKGVTGNELARADAADLDTLRQIGSGQFIRVFGHVSSLSRLCARSRCATKIGGTSLLDGDGPRHRCPVLGAVI